MLGSSYLAIFSLDYSCMLVSQFRQCWHISSIITVQFESTCCNLLLQVGRRIHGMGSTLSTASRDIRPVPGRDSRQPGRDLSSKCRHRGNNGLYRSSVKGHPTMQLIFIIVNLYLLIFVARNYYLKKLNYTDCLVIVKFTQTVTDVCLDILFRDAVPFKFLWTKRRQ